MSLSIRRPPRRSKPVDKTGITEKDFVRTELKPIEEPFGGDGDGDGHSTSSNSVEDRTRFGSLSGTGTGSGSFSSGTRPSFSLEGFPHPQPRPSDAFHSSDEDVNVVFDEDGDEVPQVPAMWEEVDPQIPISLPNPSMVTLPTGTGPTTHPWVDAPPFNIIERPAPTINRLTATFKITVSLAVVISLVVGYAIKLRIVTVGFWSFGMYGLLLCVGECMLAVDCILNSYLTDIDVDPQISSFRPLRPLLIVVG